LAAFALSDNSDNLTERVNERVACKQ